MDNIKIINKKLDIIFEMIYLHSIVDNEWEHYNSSFRDCKKQWDNLKELEGS